jgi:acetyl esterase/lipase
MALVDAIKAFRLLRSDRKSFGLRGDRLDIMGLSSGGHLAARTVQKLGDKEQPDDLFLISPEYLNETMKWYCISGSNATHTANCQVICFIFH